MDDFTDKTFIEILNQLAKEKFPNKKPRKAVADATGASETIINRYFAGHSLGEPAKYLPHVLSTLLKHKDPGYAAIVLASYLEFMLSSHKGAKSLPELGTAATYLKELALIQRTSVRSDLREGMSPNLANFPDAFYPLVVVCGDRRERPQKDWSDLVASSMSPLDLTFLLRLGLKPITTMPDGSKQKTLIFSDRLFASADDNQLRNTFGSANLLIVGSPKVNLLARRVNFSSLFRFTLKRTHQARNFHKLLETTELLRQANMVQAFAIMCRKSPHTRLTEDQRRDLGLSRKDVDDLLKLGRELLGDLTISQASEMFYPTGISDVVKRYHWTRPSDSQRLGFVSLAAHPFNPERICIFVAGLDGVSTAQCLKSLAHARKAFAEHPFGGVLTVTYRDSRREPQDALYRVEPPAYTPNKIMASLNEMSEPFETTSAKDIDAHYQPWTEEEVEEAKGLVQRLST
jgi:hypothetical protein